MNRSPHVLGCLALACCAASACNQPSSAGSAASGSASTVASAPASAAPATDVLVTVNGVPIRVSDLHYVLSRENRGKRKHGATEAQAKMALERMIGQELARQRAVELGLHNDPEYVRKLRFMQAPLTDFERTNLRELYFAKHVGKQAQVDEAEARKHFEDNRAHFQTEVRLFRIKTKPGQAKAYKDQLDAGEPFEAVAAKRYPGKHPGDKKPWEMGFLQWHQVPDHLSGALGKLKDGDVSGVLRDARGREFIIQLVERRTNEGITFETLKSHLIPMLQSAKTADMRVQAVKLLREKAKIVKVREPAAMPPPPDHDL